MLFLSLLTLCSLSLAAVYDYVPQYYQNNNYRYIDNRDALSCFNLCASDSTCTGSFTLTYDGGANCFKYTSNDGSFVGRYGNVYNTLLRADPNVPNKNLPAGSSVCTSDTCWRCSVPSYPGDNQPSYFDEKGACQPKCDNSKGCYANDAGNGCNCAVSATSTLTIASTATVFTTATPATQSHTSIIKQVSTTQTKVTSTAFTTTTPVTSSITSVIQSTTTPATFTSTAISTSSTGVLNCLSYRLTFPASCCPSMYAPMKVLRRSLEFGKRATAFNTLTQTVTQYNNFQTTSTIIAPAPQYTTSSTLIISTETDTATIIVSSTVQASTPISRTTTTSFGEAPTPRTTTSTTAYAQSTNCAISVISVQNSCPLPALAQLVQAAQISTLQYYQQLGGKPVTVDCGIAGSFSY